MPKKIERMSADATVILLLCGHLGKANQVKPLALGEYNRVARWLRDKVLRPADLLEPAHVPSLAQAAAIDASRLRTLLERGMQLGLAVENWGQSGIWVVCRSDSEYPDRLKSHLTSQAPAILFGVGNRALLTGGGVAIVGSRDIDDAGSLFAGDVARGCARGSVLVVSGGARGADQTAMTAALAEGGSVLGVLADKLLQRSVIRATRNSLANGQLLLLSPYYPEAGFNTGNAMARNKLIYAMADYGLVVSATYNRGGTWAGAIEELRRERARPIFVRLDETAPQGNRKLADRGAIVFPHPDDGHVTSEWLQHVAAMESSTQIPLFQDVTVADIVKEPPPPLSEYPIVREDME
ncbi:DNA-protecting protein DprA [Candidatus Bipolaricaulota bacterium]|nr:DNA-protecting protein DprA [Candidatus Bipolaricaulota bacterium]